MLHVIWRQGFYPGIGAPSWTADYGNETANHYDHVHIATDGGGYPTGHETYFLGPCDQSRPDRCIPRKHAWRCWLWQAWPS